MARGIVRWSSAPQVRNETAEAVQRKASELGLKPVAWSSKTLLLNFKKKNKEGKFLDFAKWLKRRQQTSGNFRVVLSAAMKNAYRKYPKS